jgi:hypothetical protein
MNAALNKLYEENMEPGARQLYLAARKAGLVISEKAVKEWIGKQEHHLEHAPNGLDKPNNWFKITDIPNSFAVDAILRGDFNKVQNEGYRGFLIFVELTTRKVYAFPFSTGSENSPPTDRESLSIFQRFEAERKAEGHPVARISGDNGKEFDNALVQKFLHSKYITTYFHRPEDHRANGTLNVAVRFIRKRIGNGKVQWLPRLKPAIDNWNDHVLRTLKFSPNFLENHKLERQDVRFNAMGHNKEVWERTALENNPIVKRYLRRNTADKGLFDKEGKTYTGDFQVGERQGYSYTLKRPDGSMLSNAYRPYELRKVPEGNFTLEKQKYGDEQKLQEANKNAKTVARKVAREIGKEPIEARQRNNRVRAPPVKPVFVKEQLKMSVEKPTNDIDTPLKILDHDWGFGKKREHLRFLIQWKDTPAFRTKWQGSKSLFVRWDDDVIASWQPWTALTQRGATNVVVDAYLKTIKEKQQRVDIERKMGLT